MRFFRKELFRGNSENNFGPLVSVATHPHDFLQHETTTYAKQELKQPNIEGGFYTGETMVFLYFSIFVNGKNDMLYH
jgi:hypothetical protein